MYADMLFTLWSEHKQCICVHMLHTLFTYVTIHLNLNVFRRWTNVFFRFGTTWGWVINDTIFIFGWTIPLNLLSLHTHTQSHMGCVSKVVSCLLRQHFCVIIQFWWIRLSTVSSFWKVTGGHHGWLVCATLCPTVWWKSLLLFYELTAQYHCLASFRASESPYWC